jgi:predicted HTH domain antitoxin
MTTLTLELGDDLVALLHQLNQPLKESVRELIVLEFYRRGTVSSGKAAQLLGMPRWEFVRFASKPGIAFFEMTEDEWGAENSRSQGL